jgi:hypothetical protein
MDTLKRPRRLTAHSLSLSLGGKHRWHRDKVPTRRCAPIAVSERPYRAR